MGYILGRLHKIFSGLLTIGNTINGYHVGPHNKHSNSFILCGNISFPFGNPRKSITVLRCISVLSFANNISLNVFRLKTDFSRKIFWKCWSVKRLIYYRGYDIFSDKSYSIYHHMDHPVHIIYNGYFFIIEFQLVKLLWSDEKHNFHFRVFSLYFIAFQKNKVLNSNQKYNCCKNEELSWVMQSIRGYRGIEFPH